MKVTRAHRGYRVNLSDGEHEALSLIVAAALTAGFSAPSLSFAGRRALSRIRARSEAEGGALAVDVDRRKEKETK